MGAAVQNFLVFTKLAYCQMVVFLIEEVTGLLSFGDIDVHHDAVFINPDQCIKWLT